MQNIENTGRFLDTASVEKLNKERMAIAEEKAEQRRQAAAKRSANWVALVAADAGLVYMIFQGLIDQKIGVVILAIASAWIARKTV